MRRLPAGLSRGAQASACPSQNPATELRRIVWTAEAVENLEAIAIYMEAFNPAAAKRMTRRLIALADSLFWRLTSHSRSASYMLSAKHGDRNGQRRVPNQ